MWFMMFIWSCDVIYDFMMWFMILWCVLWCDLWSCDVFYDVICDPVMCFMMWFMILWCVLWCDLWSCDVIYDVIYDPAMCFMMWFMILWCDTSSPFLKALASECVHFYISQIIDLPYKTRRLLLVPILSHHIS